MLEKACFVKNENMYGIPPLPTIRSLEFLTKMKNIGMGGSQRFSSSIKMVSGKYIHVHSQEGMVLISLILLFYLLHKILHFSLHELPS